MSNIIVCMADDLRYEHRLYMPRVRSIFNHEFTAHRKNTPVCGPERVGFLKGQYSKDHGIYDAGAAGFDPTTNVLPLWLAAADGVESALFGKFLGNLTTGSAGAFDHIRGLVNNNDIQSNYTYSIWDGSSTTTPGTTQPGTQIDDYLAAQIVSYLATAPDPFFAWWTPTTPHVHQTQFTHYPHPADIHTWRDSEFPVVNETDLTDKPSWLASGGVTDLEIENYQSAIRAQLQELNALDRAVETVWNALVAEDLADDTYFIFTSDNGLHYLEHGWGSFFLSSKNTAYEHDLHVPCYIRGPGIPDGETASPTNGQDLTAFVVENFGATPSIGDQVGIPLQDIIASPGTYATRELLHQGRDQTAPFPESGTGEGWDAVTTIDRKLVRWTDQTAMDEYEMYDLDTDPDELINVANIGGRLTERDDLEDILDGLLA